MTKRTRILTVAAVAALTAAPAIPAGATTPAVVIAAPGATGTTATAAPFAVAGVTLSRTSVAVSGLNTVPVTVTLRGRWTDPETERLGSGSLWVRLTRTAGTRPSPSAPADRLVELTRVAGTGDEATYRGTTRIPSTMNGAFTLTQLYPRVGEDQGNSVFESPIAVAGPTLTVKGGHIPRLSVRDVPASVPLGSARTFEVKLVDGATNKGYRHTVPFRLGTSPFEGPCFDPVRNRSRKEDPKALPRTAAGSGLWSRKRYTDPERADCLAIAPTGAGDSENIVELEHTYRYYVPMSVKADRRTVRAGRTVRVEAALRNLYPYREALLQRQAGRTWRTVGRAPVRVAGRAVLTAQPPTRGTHRYRVVMPSGSQGRLADSVSQAFTIKAS